MTRPPEPVRKPCKSASPAAGAVEVAASEVATAEATAAEVTAAGEAPGGAPSCPCRGPISR